MKIYLDDLRLPYDSTWTIVKDFQAFVDLVNETNDGDITHISFDHDLGLSLSGYDAVKWFVEQCLDEPEIGANLEEVIVHSANPVGADAIRSHFELAVKHDILPSTLDVK